MTYKFYQFDYAEMEKGEIKSLGILNYHTTKNVNRDDLKKYTREFLKNPDAIIAIPHVTKLTKKEYETLTGQKFN